MHDQSSTILSNTPLSDWRGSITTFNGFTGIKPVLELDNLSWIEVCKKVCPNQPAIIDNKKAAQYFVPCLLKESPFVGKTLEFAIQNGHPTTGKMRSKNHVTKSAMLLMDIDGISEADFNTGLAKIESDNLTYIAFTTHSHGSPIKPGMRIRLIIPLDKAIDVEKYAAAWRGFDQNYWNGLAGSADSSGANLYQQQGTWCCHSSRVEQAQSWSNEGGVASVDALIKLDKFAQVDPPTPPKANLNRSNSGINENKDYPPSDANKVADQCKQIRLFRDEMGADQTEPLWHDCLGVVVFCENGEEICQEWSSGHSGYDQSKTQKKLLTRQKTPPTTCDQFIKSNPSGCQGCIQKCHSPITLGWLDTFDHNKTFSRKAGDISKTDEEVIASLAAMPRMEYDRIRLDKAKELNVQVKTLDTLVKETRNIENKNENNPFHKADPYPDPIVPAQLLDEISAIILRFIILDAEQAHTVALWIAHTYFIDIFDTSPIAIINAPEKACAKTLLQSLIARMSYRSLSASNASASALFRSIELWKPTIFFDEADTFFRDNRDLQGLVNAGYKREGYVLRSEAVEDNFIPRQYSVYSAKSIAGIALQKHLPDTTMSRGIVFNMRRKLPHESVVRMRNADSRVFEDIKSKLTRYAQDYSQQVRLARPVLTDELSDRDQDNWEPLLAIAQSAGAEWLHRANVAALKLSNTGEAHVSSGNELLADIRYIFESRDCEKISTVDLIEALVTDDESPWATYNYGKPITPRQLAKQLTGYGIKSKTVRLGNSSTPKGYDVEQFSDAFARYLPPTLPPQSNVSPESIKDEIGSVEVNPPPDCILNDSATPIAMLELDCDSGENKAEVTTEAIDVY
ncbi:DUF3631 domain-containing protein [Nitrosomonas sp.]|uniref:DUF3631 domain-containing protein n=1 Tax=Nitrosomonas sp. TaxID=42353 RepID=UPI0025E9191B|nr:DUF3631 domain-containing protein [Nitrosomonas sp.]